MSEDRFVDAPPSGVEGWRDVWQNDRRFRPRRSTFGFLLRLFQRLLDRATRAERERQRTFDVATLDRGRDARASQGRSRGALEARGGEVLRGVGAGVQGGELVGLDGQGRDELLRGSLIDRQFGIDASDTTHL